MAEMKKLHDWANVIIREASERLGHLGVEVEVQAPRSDDSADLIVTIPRGMGTPQHLLIEAKTARSGEYIPSGIISAATGSLQGFGQRMGYTDPRYCIVTDRKLGEAGARLSAELNISVIPEVETGEQLAEAIYQIVNSEGGTA